MAPSEPRHSGTFVCDSCKRRYLFPKNVGDRKYTCQTCGTELNLLPEAPAQVGQPDKSLVQKLPDGFAGYPRKSLCPACGAQMQDGTVLCCQCGLDTRTGKRLKTNIRDDSANAARYSRVVKICGIIGASVGALLLGVCFVAFFGYGYKLTLKALSFPLVGWLFGVGTACAVAPPNFFLTPSAERWLNVIGTYNPVLARAVCIFALAVLAAIAAMIVYLAYQ